MGNLRLRGVIVDLIGGKKKSSGFSIRRWKYAENYESYKLFHSKCTNQNVGVSRLVFELQLLIVTLSVDRLEGEPGHGNSIGPLLIIHDNLTTQSTGINIWKNKKNASMKNNLRKW